MTHCPACFRLRRPVGVHICLPARVHPFQARHGAQREAATRGGALGRGALTAHEIPAPGPSRLESQLELGRLLELLGFRKVTV